MHFNYLVLEQIVAMEANNEAEALERMKAKIGGLHFERINDLNNMPNEKFKFSVVLSLTDNIWTLKELKVNASEANELLENINKAINTITVVK